MLMPVADTSLPLKCLLPMPSSIVGAPRLVKIKSWLFDSLPAGVVAVFT